MQVDEAASATVAASLAALRSSSRPPVMRNTPCSNALELQDAEHINTQSSTSSVYKSKWVCVAWTRSAAACSERRI